MGALTEISILIVQTLINLYLLAVLLRLLLQVARADFYNPLSQFLVKLTNPLLLPVRRLVPGLWGIDMAALLLAIVVQFIGLALVISLLGYTLPNLGLVLVWAVLGCVGMVLNIYFFAVLVSIILSWVAPGSHHPGAILLHQLVQPVMAPFRRLLPAMGGLDLSPIFVFLAINVIQVLLRHGAAAVGMPVRLVFGL